MTFSLTDGEEEKEIGLAGGCQKGFPAGIHSDICVPWGNLILYEVLA